MYESSTTPRWNISLGVDTFVVELCGRKLYMGQDCRSLSSVPRKAHVVRLCPYIYICTHTHIQTRAVRGPLLTPGSLSSEIMG